MKLIIVAILFATAMWVGTWLGHVGDRHIKPQTLNVEEVAP